MIHMNRLFVALKRRDWNGYHILPNVFCIIELTKILIVIDIVWEVSKSLEMPSNVIQ